MKKSLMLLCAGFVLFGMVEIASATLIGDTVAIEHYYDGSLLGGSSVVVVDGSSDIVIPNQAYEVNVEAYSILVDYIYETEGDIWWTETLDFNGLVVSSLDDSTGAPLQAVTIDTNLVGWDMSRLSFLADAVYFDWQGIHFADDGLYFNATLDFGEAPVPEPSTILLLGSGLAGLAFYRRKRK